MQVKLGAISLSAALLAVFSGSAMADEGLKVEPGQWDTTVEVNMKMNMHGQETALPPQTQTRSECVTEDDAAFTPDELSDETCSVSNVQETSSTLAFDISCNQGGATVNGDMSFERGADGKSVSGVFKMAGGQTGVQMDISGKISGKRVGTCS